MEKRRRVWPISEHLLELEPSLPELPFEKLSIGEFDLFSGGLPTLNTSKSKTKTKIKKNKKESKQILQILKTIEKTNARIDALNEAVMKIAEHVAEIKKIVEYDPYQLPKEVPDYYS